MLVWGGVRTFGKVDVVPDTLYVCTQFVHVMFIPVIPIRSYIVLVGTETGNGFRGVPTSLSIKSVLAGWVRAAMVFFCFSGFVGAFAECSAVLSRSVRHPLALLVPPAMIGLSVFIYWATVRFSRPSLNRAMRLADQLGVSRLAVAKVVHPDRTDEELATQLEDYPEGGTDRYRE
jgi:hypothetical protein